MKATDPLRPQFEAPRETFFGRGAVLAAAVHIGLVAALIFGVHWQSRAPSVVTVELWRPAPAPVARPEPPKVEPPKPAPPPPAKPEPRIEKPDIAVKAPRKPKPKPKPEPKPEPRPKPAPKPVAKPAPKPDDTLAQRLLAEALQREQSTLDAERERQRIKEQLAREAAAARDRQLDSYVAKIRAKVKGNFNVSLLVEGNPEATVLVTQLPTGEILDAKLVIPSGNRAYDEDVLRAILKSSPLPKPDSPALFQRTLKLTFRPRD